MSSVMLLIGVLFFTKHFLADFPLQSGWMLGKAKPGVAFVLPLTAHCAVHAGLTAIILLVFSPGIVWLAGAEFVAHFIIDRLKCLYKLPAGTWAPEVRGKYLAKYYTAFGLDQWAHAMCYLAIMKLMGVV